MIAAWSMISLAAGRCCPGMSADATRFVPYQCLIRCAVPPLIPARGKLAAVKTMTIRDDA